jgi:hypothetical protein
MRPSGGGSGSGLGSQSPGERQGGAGRPDRRKGPAALPRVIP